MVSYLCFFLLICTATAAPKPRTSIKITDASPVGLRAIGSQAGVNYLLNQVFPIVANRIRSMPLPSQILGSSHDFDYHVDSLVLQSLSYSATSVAMVNDVSFTVTGVGVTVTGNWGYQLSTWPHYPSGGGGVTITLSNAEIDIHGTLSVTASGSLAFALTTVNVIVNDINVSCSGSVFDWLYNIIANAVKGDVSSAIQNAVKNAFTNLVPPLISQLLADIPLSTQVASNLYFDTHFVSTQIASNSPGFLAVSAVGSFENSSHVPSNMPRHTFPAAAAPANYASFDIDAYVFNSLFQLENLGTYKIYANDPNLPPGFDLNTATFMQLLPELYNKFPGYTIMFEFTQAQPFLMSITSAAPTLYSVFNWTWMVSNDKNPDPLQKNYTDAFTLTTYVDLAGNITFNVSVNPPLATLSASVSYLTISLASSTIGNFSTDAFGAFLNAFVQGVSSMLTRSFPLPTIPGLALKTPSVVYGDNYATASFSFTYTPPQKLRTTLSKVKLA